MNKYPKAKYHPTLEPRLVNNAEEESALGYGWGNHPNGPFPYPICELHKTEMKQSVGWYGTKHECAECLRNGVQPNGKAKAKEIVQEAISQRFDGYQVYDPPPKRGPGRPRKVEIPNPTIVTEH